MTPSPADTEERMIQLPKHTLAEVVAFLCGEEQLEGVWFSEPHPTERGAYWWRKHLRAAADQMQEAIRLAVEAERERCAKLCEVGAESWEWMVKNEELSDVGRWEAIAKGQRECAAAIRKTP